MPKKRICLLLSLSFCLSSPIYCATAKLTVNANKYLCQVSPYIFGHNSSNYYYKGTLTRDDVKQELKGVIKMLRLPPGAGIQRFDFKRNNYKGGYWSGWLGAFDTTTPKGVSHEE